MKMKFIVPAFAALALAAPAHAADKSLGVRYSDLDLSTDAGKAVLGKRLTKAAERKCGRIGGDISANAMIRRCQTTEISRIRAAISEERKMLAQN